MAHGTGTSHHKVHGLTGWGLIIGLPFAICSAVCAVRMGTPDAPASGFITWLSNPIYGLGFLAFFTAAVWYCKLEFDEVIMDYFGGGARSFGLLASKLIAFIAWALAAYAIIKLAFLG